MTYRELLAEIGQELAAADRSIWIELDSLQQQVDALKSFPKAIHSDIQIRFDIPRGFFNPYEGGYGGGY